MIRNIDVLQEIQNKVNKFNILTDELSVILDTEKTEISDLIENGDSVTDDILKVINDIDKMLGVLTEDIRSSMLTDGFDCDDFKMWNAKLRYCPFNLEGLLETFEGAFETLEFYILETVKGYKILTQFAYESKSLLKIFEKAEIS